MINSRPLITILPSEMGEILSEEKNLGNYSCPLYAAFYEDSPCPFIWPFGMPDGWKLIYRTETQEAWLADDDTPQAAKGLNQGGLWFVGDTKSIDWSQVSMDLGDYDGVVDPAYCASMDDGTPSWVCKCCFASNPGDSDKCKSCGSSKPA